MVRREASLHEGDPRCIYCCLPCIVCFMGLEKILQLFCVGTLWTVSYTHLTLPTSDLV